MTQEQATAMTLVEAIEYIRNDEAHSAALVALQEVREVLLGLETHALSAGDAAEHHWCKPDGRCSNVCQRARALMETLEVRP